MTHDPRARYCRGAAVVYDAQVIRAQRSNNLLARACVQFTILGAALRLGLNHRLGSIGYDQGADTACRGAVLTEPAACRPDGTWGQAFRAFARAQKGADIVDDPALAAVPLLATTLDASIGEAEALLRTAPLAHEIDEVLVDF